MWGCLRVNLTLGEDLDDLLVQFIKPLQQIFVLGFEPKERVEMGRWSLHGEESS